MASPEQRPGSPLSSLSESPSESSSISLAPPPPPPKPPSLRAPVLPVLPPRPPPPLPPKPEHIRAERSPDTPPPLPPRPNVKQATGKKLLLEHTLTETSQETPPPVPPRQYVQLVEEKSEGEKGDKKTVEETEKEEPEDVARQAPANVAKEEEKGEVPLPFPLPMMNFRLGAKLGGSVRAFLKRAGSSATFYTVENKWSLSHKKENVTRERKIGFGRTTYDDQPEAVFSDGEIEETQNTLVSPTSEKGEEGIVVPRSRELALELIMRLLMNKFAKEEAETGELLVETLTRRLLEQDDLRSRSYSFTFLFTVGAHAAFMKSPDKRARVEHCVTGLLSNIIESMHQRNERSTQLWNQALRCMLSFLNGTSDDPVEPSLLALAALGLRIDPSCHPSVEEALIGRAFCRVAGLNTTAEPHVLRESISERILYENIGGLDTLLDLFLKMRSIQSRRNLFGLILEVAISRVLKHGQYTTSSKFDRKLQIRWLGAIFSSYELWEAFAGTFKHKAQSSFVLDCVRHMFFEPLMVQKFGFDEETNTDRDHREAVVAANRFINQPFALHVLASLESMSVEYRAKHRARAADNSSVEIANEVEQRIYGIRDEMRSGGPKEIKGLRTLLSNAVAEVERKNANFEGALRISESLLSFLLLPVPRTCLCADSEPSAFLQGERRVLVNMVVAIDWKVYARLLQLLAPKLEKRYISEIRQVLVELLGLTGELSRASQFINDGDVAVAERAALVFVRASDCQSPNIVRQLLSKAQSANSELLLQNNIVKSQLLRAATNLGEQHSAHLRE